MQRARSSRVRWSLTRTVRQPRSGSVATKRLTTSPRAYSGVVAGGAARRRGQRGPDLPEQLPAGLVEAHDRAGRVEGARVDRQHVLHAPDEVGVGGRGQAPLLAQVRLERVFERLAHRLVETASTSVWRTVVGDGLHHLQAHQLVGQQAHQLVGQQAQAPARLAVRGRGAGQRDEVRLLRAVQPPLVHAVRPSPLQRRRQPFGDELAAHAQHGARVGLTSSAPAMAASDHPGPPSPWSALSRMRARVSVRAGAVPLPTRPRSSARCASERTTRYGYAMAGPPEQGGGANAHAPHTPCRQQITADTQSTRVCWQTHGSVGTWYDDTN